MGGVVDAVSSVFSGPKKPEAPPPPPVAPGETPEAIEEKRRQRLRQAGRGRAATVFAGGPLAQQETGAASRALLS